MVLAPEKEKSTPLLKEGHSLDQWIESRDENPEQLSELQGYLGKIEREPSNKEPVLDDQTGQPLLTPTDHEQPTITLPLTEDEIRQGLHHKIIDGLKWLALFCVRLTKKATRRGIKVEYQN